MEKCEEWWSDGKEKFYWEFFWTFKFRVKFIESENNGKVIRELEVVEVVESGGKCEEWWIVVERRSFIGKARIFFGKT